MELRNGRRYIGTLPRRSRIVAAPAGLAAKGVKAIAVHDDGPPLLIGYGGIVPLTFIPEPEGSEQ